MRGLTNRAYAYDAEDHLTAAGDASFTYDLDGFLASKAVAGQTTSYRYSSRGELLRVDLPSGDVVAYTHDPLGRRIAKALNGTVVEKYLWQGRTRLLAVYDGNGSLKQRFEYADGRMPVAMTVGGTRYFLIYDQVGSLRAVTNASGGVVKTVEYDSFGNVIADSNTSFAVPFGFAGGLFDSDTGLTRFGYRDYDADVGRWTAKDPIGFEGGDTDLYGYVVGDPVNGVDGDGLLTFGLGLSASASFGPRSATLSAGIVMDSSGNIGTYTSGGFGQSAGADKSGGITASFSNAKTIGDLAGPFVEGSIGGGWGPHGSGSYFTGDSPNGKVFGGSVTFGYGQGFGGSSSMTYTGISPWGGQSQDNGKSKSPPHIEGGGGVGSSCGE